MSTGDRKKHIKNVMCQLVIGMAGIVDMTYMKLNKDTIVNVK